MGFNDLGWLWEYIDKALLSNKSKEFFKHRRDGYKALHIIRRSNRHVNFLEVFVFHSGSRQGVIRVPEGENSKGWGDFSHMCKENWITNTHMTGTQVVTGVDWR